MAILRDNNSVAFILFRGPRHPVIIIIIACMVVMMLLMQVDMFQMRKKCFYASCRHYAYKIWWTWLQTAQDTKRYSVYNLLWNVILERLLFNNITSISFSDIENTNTKDRIFNVAFLLLHFLRLLVLCRTLIFFWLWLMH